MAALEACVYTAACKETKREDAYMRAVAYSFAQKTQVKSENASIMWKKKY